MLCDQIRRIPELADLILVVLTSGDRAEDPSVYKQLGVATHLLKPVKPSELLRIILQILGKIVDQQETDTGRLEPAAESSTKPLRPICPMRPMRRRIGKCLSTRFPAPRAIWRRWLPGDRVATGDWRL